MKRLLTITVMIVISSFLAFGQWQVLKESTVDMYPDDAFFLDADTGWLIEDHGFVKKTTDGGATWTTLREEDDGSVYWQEVEFYNADIGYVAADDGFIYKTTDGGTTWSMIGDTANYTLDVVCVSVVDANTVYFSCDDGQILKTTDGGTTFSADTLNTTDDLDGGISFFDANNGVVATDANNGDTWYTADGGATWTNVNIAALFPQYGISYRLYDIQTGPSNTVVAVGYHNTVFISTDGGQSYAASGGYNLDYVRYQRVSIVDANTFVVAGSDGAAKMTTDGGSNWTELPVGSGQTIGDIAFTDASTGYVFGYNGQWMKTTDGGASFMPLNDWPSVSFWGLGLPETDKIMVSGYGGGELSSSVDGGMTWTYPDNLLTGTPENLYELEFIDTNNGILGGGSGVLMTTTDGGASWTVVDNPMAQASNKHVNAIHVYDANTIFAGGSSGYLMKSSDGGATWTDTQVNSSTVYDIYALDANTVLASESSGKFCYAVFDGSGAVVTDSLIIDVGSNSMRAVKVRNNVVLVAASSGSMFRTTLSELDTLVEVFSEPDGDDFYDVEFLDDNNVVAVGENGKIYKSEDAGLTWVADMSVTDETLQKVKYDGTYLWAVGQGGVILKREFNPMVTFQVNMSAQIAEGNFVDTVDYVDVAGSFNGWGADDRLSDEDGDSIYTVTLEMPAGDIEYKYRINGNWDTSESVGNRTYTVVEGDNVIPVVWYSDYDPSAIVDADVFFYADMSIQLLNGNFDPDGGDIAIVRGFPNGWAGEDFVLTESSTVPGLYVNHWTFDNLSLDVAQEFKFVIHKADGTDMWESSPNRSLTIPSDHSFIDSDSDGYVEVPTDTAFFADVGWEDVISQDVTVYFNVNLQSAVNALNDGEVLIDSQTDADTISAVSEIDAVYINGLLGNWWDWGTNPTEFKMMDDGLNGDATAGDGIYTVGYTFTAGQAKEQTYKYGLNSLDNEAGFAENRTMTIDDAAATFYPETDCFGEQNTDERLPFPEYGCPGVGIDGELAALPNRYALHQNFPNPFNPTTQISFEMPRTSNVRLEIYNILGQKVRTLVSSDLTAGFHVYEWDAMNDAGQRMAAGVYIYQLTAGDFVQHKKMLLLK